MTAAQALAMHSYFKGRLDMVESMLEVAQAGKESGVLTAAQADAILVFLRIARESLDLDTTEPMQ